MLSSAIPTPSHTPGPWHAFPIDRWGRYQVYEAVMQFEQLSESGAAAQMKAIDFKNSHLIAAAPELLAACRAALSCQLDVLDEATVDALEAAVARADGR